MFRIQLIVILALIVSCNNGPKVIETGYDDNVSTQSGNSTGIFSDAGTSSAASSETNSNSGGAFSNDLHKVKVLETLNTSKYIYLRVQEGEEEFWIATRKMNVEVNAYYFYRGGLLKTNFESKEYDKVFDKIYLVSNLVPENHSQQGGMVNSGNEEPVQEATAENNPIVQWPVDPEVKKNSISISELVKNKEDYEGKTVQLSGKCTKINPNIMGRNWIHLKDGSMDEYDLVLTSNIAIPEGHEVTLKGTVALNKDFGAGYSYELLVENATLVR